MYSFIVGLLFYCFILFLGTGFSNTACENQILIGTYSCPIISSTSTELVCQISTNSGLLAGVSYSIQIQIANIGNAIHKNINSFKFIPSITSITPNIGINIFYLVKLIIYSILQTGSSNGGTSVQISGDGFLIDSAVVSLGGITYSKSNTNFNISYSSISLITSSSAVGSNSIAVYVNGVQAICSASSNCNYQFSSNVAPTILAISPTSVSSSSIMTITGSQFGTDITKLTVTIGNSNCNITAVTVNSITCSLNSLNVGQQGVVVNLISKLKY